VSALNAVSDVAVKQTEIVLDIEGMTCASCVNRIEKALGGIGTVQAAAVNLANRTATVVTSGGELDELIHAVQGAGYGAHLHRGERSAADETRALARRLVVSVFFTIPVVAMMLLAPGRDWSAWLAWAFTTPVLVYGGWPFIKGAWRAALHRAATMDTLVSTGSIAAYGYSVYEVVIGRRDPYFDTAAVIVTLILVGKTLEAKARTAAADASRMLLQKGTGTATRLDGGVQTRVAIEDLHPGDVVVVLPGDKIPTDGVVKEGVSWVDLSLLTGESVPQDVGPGDEVVGASVNGHGRLVVFVTKVGANTKLAEMVRLLERAQGSKAPVQRLADRISGVFVPIVLVLATATFVGWTFVADPGVALMRAVAVLLIACPCALGLATPAAIMAGVGRAAELGVLFKGGEVFEAAHRADRLLLDKTGTLTQGQMAFASAQGVNGFDQDRLLSLAAAVESGSGHPIARAVMDEAERRRLQVPTADGLSVQAGAGATGMVGGQEVRAGRPSSLPPAMVEEVENRSVLGETAFAVWVDQIPAGIISVTDRIKPEASTSVSRMRALGLEVAMITGDRLTAARAVAREAGIDRVMAEVFPADKVHEVERLRQEGRKVVFVGDGINDAPALAAADVGIAMGTGTDVALSAADVNIMGGSLASVADALELARKTYRVITQNLFWAFIYNVVMIPLAVSGALSPTLAAGAMAASSVSVVLNALRLRRFGVPGNRSDAPAEV
jgi:P-type Cu+ transporter